MKPLLSLLVILLLFTSCKTHKNGIDKIVLDFKHFKYPHTEFTIKCRKNKMVMKWLSKEGRQKTIYKKAYRFTDENLEVLNKVLSINMTDPITYKGEDGMDGGGFKISYYYEDGHITGLYVGNPGFNFAKYKPELKKLEAFFQFAYNIVKDSTGTYLLDESYDPFYDGLPVRKISDNPLEYKIWGSIGYYTAHNPGFINFLDSLPSNRCVIIDCNNNFSYGLEENIIKLLFIRKPNVKFVNSSYFNHLYESLLEIRNKLKSQDVNKQEIENNEFYKLYQSAPEVFDKWLMLPKELAVPSLETIRKQCK